MTDEYDWRKRARLKALSREGDEREIRDGRSSPEEVQARNGFIPGHIARQAKIIEWRPLRDTKKIRQPLIDGEEGGDPEPCDFATFVHAHSAVGMAISAAEYDGLAGIDHVALAPNELERTDLVAIHDAVVPNGARELDRLLD
jgi:hypothetical protein